MTRPATLTATVLIAASFAVHLTPRAEAAVTTGEVRTAAGVGVGASAATGSTATAWSGSGVVLRLGTPLGTADGEIAGSIVEQGYLTPIRVRPTSSGWRGVEIVNAQERPITITRSGGGPTPDVVVDRQGKPVTLRPMRVPNANQRSGGSSTVIGGSAAPAPVTTARPDVLFRGGIEIGGRGNGGNNGGGGAGGIDGGAGDGGRNDAPSAPSFVQPGMRVTYELLSSSTPPAGSDKQGAASRGFQQVTITGVAGDSAAVEVRSFLPDFNGGRGVIGIGSEVKLSSLSAAAEYWFPPRKLAELADGARNGMDVRRLSYPSAGTTYRAIRITTTGEGRTEKLTFDLDSGMLIAWSSDATGRDGTKHIGLLNLLRVRRTTLPWTTQQPSRALMALRSMSWSGTYNTAVDGAYELSSELTRQWEIARVDQLTFDVRETSTLTTPGYAPNTTTAAKTYPIAGAWIDPAILSRLRPEAVLDDDPVTGLRTTVSSVANGKVVMIERGPVQTIATVYDLRTGFVVAGQLQQRQQPGTTTVYLERTGMR